MFIAFSGMVDETEFCFGGDLDFSVHSFLSCNLFTTLCILSKNSLKVGKDLDNTFLYSSKIEAGIA